MLSITTDYLKDTGNPEPYLRRIAQAGFSHVHWCHHWHDDFLYSKPEIDQIASWLKVYGLRLTDLHGSEGKEKSWLSPHEHERLAGVELVKNRLEMAARLGSDVVIMHVPAEPEPAAEKDVFWARLQKSFDTLEPVAASYGVRLAVENLIVDNFDTIEKIFARYGPDFVGLCYDSGHANIEGDRMHRLASLKERLLSLHLHDNNGSGDHHQLLFSQTVDWSRLARLIADSAYAKCVSMEVTIHHTGLKDERVFLTKAFETGTRFAQMIEE
jgi:sugar phosphate isomerase/epimerase